MGQPRQEEDRVERHPKQGKEAEAEADKVADGPEGETGPKPGKPHKAEGTWKVVMEATAARGLILPLFATALIADGASAFVCRERLYHGLAKPFLALVEGKAA